MENNEKPNTIGDFIGIAFGFIIVVIQHIIAGFMYGFGFGAMINFFLMIIGMGPDNFLMASAIWGAVGVAGSFLMLLMGGGIALFSVFDN